MSVVVVGTTLYGAALQSWLAKETQALQALGVQVDVSTWQVEQETFISCHRVNGSRATEEVFLYHVAKAIAETIHNDIETAWVQKQIQQGTRAIREDREKIAEHVFGILRTPTSQEDTPRQQIICYLMSFLGEHPSVHIEGFFRFRLAEYQTQVAQAIAEGRQWLQAQKEHEEFVDLLRYFVDAQESKVNKIDVIVNRLGLFRLLDEDNNVIENEYLEGFVSDLIEGEIDYGDLLMSSLITLAPRLICCHFEVELPVVETLKGVFMDRISFCEGCKVCHFRAGEKQKNTAPHGPIHW